MSAPQPVRTIQGTSVPALGYGTWELEGDDCFTGVMTALELGYRHLDTAQIYGNEQLVGAALTASEVPRDDVFLTTKVWNDHMTAEAVKASFGESLSKLETDHVDLLVLHWALDESTWAERLGAMVDLVEHGGVRHLGVSNFTPSQLRRAMDIAPIFSVQVEHHPYLAQPGLLEMAAEHDLLFTAYSPLARGEVLEDPTITEIAERLGVSPVQVVLRWLMDQSDHLAVIPKATGRDHIEANLAATGVELTGADREAIAGLDRNERQVAPPWAPDPWER